ncbi:MAG: hypothetical protein H6Q76_791 [Firmicutes bacterium]|nr:hypothetical protein [Bacillota bacterium]
MYLSLTFVVEYELFTIHFKRRAQEFLLICSLIVIKNIERDDYYNASSSTDFPGTAFNHSFS